MSYKRPTIRRVAPAYTEFTTEIRANGTRVSTWGPPRHKPRIVSGTPGVVGSIVDKMRLGDDHILRPSKKPWTPPSDYEFIIKHLPVGEREAYLARCTEWFAASPTPPPVAPKLQPELDTELISAMYAKHGDGRPPLEERIKVYRASGYGEDYIEKVRARDKRWKETKAEREAAFELIFAKWPSASKPTPKPKKVIKAVKKRMNP